MRPVSEVTEAGATETKGECMMHSEVKVPRARWVEHSVECN